MANICTQVCLPVVFAVEDYILKKSYKIYLTYF